MPHNVGSEQDSEDEENDFKHNHAQIYPWTRLPLGVWSADMHQDYWETSHTVFKIGKRILKKRANDSPK